MFGAVFLFVLFESIFYRDNLSGIAFLISIPIFILSLIKIIIDISEDINDKITSFLSNVENYPTYYDDFSWEYLEQINACSDNTFKDTIENIISDKPNLNHLKDIFKHCLQIVCDYFIKGSEILISKPFYCNIYYSHSTVAGGLLVIS